MELSPLRAGAVGVLLGLVLAVGLIGGGPGVVEPRVADSGSLAGHTVWMDGTVTSVGDQQIGLSTPEGTVNLRSTDGTLLRPDGGSWETVEWSTLSEGTELCLSAEVGESGRLDVVTAYVGVDCVPPSPG